MRKEYLQAMKGGKLHPTWPGVLDAATEAGLKSLTTGVLQLPTAENGQLAVVLARAEFADGRVFEDVGDCSPQSASPQIAVASLRMASTRAKSRVLRDALNLGEELLEGVHDAGPTAHRVQGAEPVFDRVICQEDGCGALLNPGEVKISIARAKAGLLQGAGPFCAAHVAAHTARPT